jgi:hypothetical protein
MHTPEPRAVSKERWGESPCAEDDAKRIVACINYCAGLTNEELEKGR